MRCSGCSGPTSAALYIRSTTLSENQYDPKFMAIAITNANIRPNRPPSISPISSSNALSRVNSSAVLKVFPIFLFRSSGSRF